MRNWLIGVLVTFAGFFLFWTLIITGVVFFSWLGQNVSQENLKAAAIFLGPPILIGTLWGRDLGESTRMFFYRKGWTK